MPRLWICDPLHRSWWNADDDGCRRYTFQAWKCRDVSLPKLQSDMWTLKLCDWSMKAPLSAAISTSFLCFNSHTVLYSALRSSGISSSCTPSKSWCLFQFWHTSRPAAESHKRIERLLHSNICWTRSCFETLWLGKLPLWLHPDSSILGDQAQFLWHGCGRKQPSVFLCRFKNSWFRGCHHQLKTPVRSNELTSVTPPWCNPGNILATTSVAMFTTRKYDSHFGVHSPWCHWCFYLTKRNSDTKLTPTERRPRSVLNCTWKLSGEWSKYSPVQSLLQQPAHSSGPSSKALSEWGPWEDADWQQWIRHSEPSVRRCY